MHLLPLTVKPAEPAGHTCVEPLLLQRVTGAAALVLPISLPPQTLWRLSQSRTLATCLCVSSELQVRLLGNNSGFAQ